MAGRCETLVFLFMAVGQTAIASRSEVSLHDAGNLTVGAQPPSSTWAKHFVALFSQKWDRLTVPTCVRSDSDKILRSDGDAHIEHLRRNPADSADCLIGVPKPAKIADVHAFHPGTASRDQIHSLTTNIVPGNGMHERGVLNGNFKWSNDAFVIWHEIAEKSKIQTFDVVEGGAPPDLEALRAARQLPVNNVGIKANAWHPPAAGEDYDRVLSLYSDVILPLGLTSVGLYDVFSYDGKFGTEAWCLVSLEGRFSWTGCKNVHAAIAVHDAGQLDRLVQRFGCPGCGGFDPLRFDWQTS